MKRQRLPYPSPRPRGKAPPLSLPPPPMVAGGQPPCNQCERTPQTVFDLEHCHTCVRDGTANEVRPYDPAMPLEEAVGHKPGLASRFSPEPAAQAEAFADQPAAPKPGLMARLRKKRS